MLRPAASAALGVAWRRSPVLSELRLPTGLLGLVAPWPPRRSFSSEAPGSIAELESTKKNIRGRFGIEFFGGRRPFDTTYQMPDPPKTEFKPGPYSLQFSKYPGIASGLGAEYFYRPGQRSPLSYFHMRSPASGDTVHVGATN